MDKHSYLFIRKLKIIFQPIQMTFISLRRVLQIGAFDSLRGAKKVTIQFFTGESYFFQQIYILLDFRERMRVD